MSFCTQCGAQLAPEASFCGQCGAPVEIEDSGATVGTMAAAAQPTAQPATGPAVVGLGLRFLAQLVDCVIILLLFWMIGSSVADVTGGATESGFNLEGGAALAVILLTAIAAIAYFTLTEAYWGGQTLGKKLVRIRVSGEDGAPCSLNQSLVRNVARLVDGFAFYLVGVIFILLSAKKQRFGDRIANTIVVKKPKGAKFEQPSEKKKSSRIEFSVGKSKMDF